jgi:hypothetical protein
MIITFDEYLADKDCPELQAVYVTTDLKDQDMNAETYCYYLAYGEE